MKRRDTEEPAEERSAGSAQASWDRQEPPSVDTRDTFGAPSTYLLAAKVKDTEGNRQGRCRWGRQEPPIKKGGIM